MEQFQGESFGDSWIEWKNAFERNRRCEQSCWQGVTQGQGGTYDPEAVEGYMGMEALQVFQPPLVRVRVGEVCKGSEARPDLWGHHKMMASMSKWSVGYHHTERGTAGV